MEDRKRRIAGAVREETMERIAEAVRTGLGKGVEVRAMEVGKNNGVVLHGLAVAKAGSAVSQIIYIDGMLGEIESGKVSVLEAAKEVVEIYVENDGEGFVPCYADKIDRQAILDGVTYELVNAGKNAGRLSEMPHRDFLDLAVTYSVPIRKDGIVVASFAVNRKICDGYGIGEEELDAAARRNAGNEEYVVHHMSSILAGIIGVDETEAGFGCPLYVLTNGRKHKGAAVMLFGEYFDRLSEELGGDLYVLPSSVHEVIAVPAADADVEKLLQMVKEVNATEVSDVDFLSDSVYRYSRAEGRLDIA